MPPFVSVRSIGLIKLAKQAGRQAILYWPGRVLIVPSPLHGLPMVRVLVAEEVRGEFAPKWLEDGCGMRMDAAPVVDFEAIEVRNSRGGRAWAYCVDRADLDEVLK